MQPPANYWPAAQGAYYPPSGYPINFALGYGYPAPAYGAYAAPPVAFPGSTYGNSGLYANYPAGYFAQPAYYQPPTGQNVYGYPAYSYPANPIVPTGYPSYWNYYQGRSR